MQVKVTDYNVIIGAVGTNHHWKLIVGILFKYTAYLPTLRPLVGYIIIIFVLKGDVS